MDEAAQLLGKTAIILPDGKIGSSQPVVKVD